MHVIVVVCFVCLFAQNTSEQIYMKFSGKVDNWPINRRLNLGGDPGQGSGHGYGSGQDVLWRRYALSQCLCSSYGYYRLKFS